MNTFEIFIKVIPIIIVIILGYILTRADILKDNMVDAFKKIVVNVTLPVALFSAFIKIRFKSEYLLIFLSVFLACILLFLIAKLIAKVFKIKSKYFPFLLTGFEAGMIGYALFMAVFGHESAADFGIADIGQVSFVFLIFVPMLINLNNKAKGLDSIKQSFTIVIKSPVILAIILGLVGSFAGIWMYEDTLLFGAFDNIFTFISAPTAFLICLVIGNGLKLTFKGLKMELITAVLKIVLSLTIAFILKYTVFIPLGVDKQIVTALFVLFCLPGPFVIPVFMQNPSIDDVNYISNTLSIGSILAVISFIVIVLVGL
ncbi:MAG: hypothetical protein KAQ68_06390 [Clostridiales bacterium]|nr:hypothetical protein [Clostridiales bacterium]